MAIKIAINGYGRIGRGVHRLAMNDKDIEIVAINSRASAESHAYLLKHDSIYGWCDADISATENSIIVNGKEVAVYQIYNPEDLPWEKHDIDIVIESTGKFTATEDVEKHLKAGAKKVLITAPCKDPDVPNIVMGVNEGEYKAADYKVISNASCTTNCLAPVMKVLHKEFGVESALVSSIHAFTYTQNLLDNSNPKDFRRARATTESIIPTTTGAMKAIGRVIPELDGKVDGMAFRVPIPTVSCVDIVVELGKEISADDVNNAFRSWEKGKMKGVLGVTDEPLVSVDFRGDQRSAIVDAELTKVLAGRRVKVIAWYDNEWGYISRVMDLLKWFYS